MEGRPAPAGEAVQMQNKPRLTYANVVSTAALFLALSGGVAFAASKIHTKDIFKRSVTSGKLAVGAVRSNQIANGAIGATQVANGAIGSKQIGPASVAPANLQFPTYFAASPVGGSLPVPGGESTPYPLSNATWNQAPGQINVAFGAAVGTLAYDGGGSGSCQVNFRIDVNGQTVGGGGLSTESTTPQQIEQSLGAQPAVDPTAPVTNRLTIEINSNEGCTASSRIDSTRFRVLDFG
jgi:hypothetical protein